MLAQLVFVSSQCKQTRIRVLRDKLQTKIFYSPSVAALCLVVIAGKIFARGASHLRCLSYSIKVQVFSCFSARWKFHVGYLFPDRRRVA